MTKKLKFPCGCEIVYLDLNSFEPPDCPAVWKLFEEGNTVGIFQLEKPLGQTWSKRVKPKNIEELAALISVLRPGPLESGMSDNYVKVKRGEIEASYLHEELEPILSPTHASLIYQEQSIKIARELAGFSLSAADTLRKSLSKKNPALLAKVKQDFLDGIEKTGKVPKEMGETIFDWIEKGQRYLFVKCVSGDTIIGKYPNKHGTPPLCVRDMYLIRHDIDYAKNLNKLQMYKKWKFYGNYGISFSIQDNRLKENTIKNIRFAGYQEVYRVTLEDKRFIEVSYRHKFPTPDGEKRLYDLKVGDLLYIKGHPLPRTKKYGWSNHTVEDRKGYRGAKPMKGPQNNWYTNGEFTKWKQNIALLDAESCELCGKTGCKIHIHHKDKNRENNELDNLQPLCVSCHLKEEYKIGRVKRGEKGYQLSTSKIVSIENIGLKDVWDVEMEAPHHTWITDQGIVTCNSHAVEYAITAYQTAYFKVHFPKEFFCAYLNDVREKPKWQEDISILCKNAISMGINIVPPDIIVGNGEFEIRGEEILFGLNFIKNVGANALEDLKSLIKAEESRLNKPIKDFTWPEFLIKILFQINSQAAVALINSGALRFLNMSRTQLLYEYQKISKLSGGELEWITQNCEGESNLADLLVRAAKPKKEGGAIARKNRLPEFNSLIQVIQNPTSPMKDSATYICNNEFATLGISLTTHSLLDFKVDSVTHTCQEAVTSKPEIILVAVNIDLVKNYIIKKGKSQGQEMAFITISDETGSLEVVAFPETWSENQCFLVENNKVYLACERGKKDSYIIKKVQEISNFV